jgi:hypothetical protein
VDDGAVVDRISQVYGGGMNDKNGKDQKHGFPWLIVFLIALPMLYVLGHAPLVRISAKSPGDPPIHIIGTSAASVPIDWLLLNTPLKSPLLRWGRMWDVNYGEDLNNTSRRSASMGHVMRDGRIVLYVE